MVTRIEVLGTGCAKCKRLEKNVLKAIEEAGATAEVVKVSDIDEIVNRGVMMTPGLVMDGEVVAAGRVPSVDEIKDMIARR
jgi:small redox-active disulfide protein 2